MATIDELVIQLSADTKELQAEMRAATQIMAKSSSDMAKSMEDFSKKASKDAGFFQNALSTMAGYISGEAVIGAFKSLKDAMVGAIEDGIQGAIEGQNAFVAFSQALVTTGKYSETSANQFRMFADEIQNTTGISAEAALGVGKLLSSFTNLDISQMETATKAIADFATLTGVDMDMAARMFAKAMDGQSEAFKKYNVQIKEGATESETFKNIVDALNSKSMGAAAAQANTYSGALKILKMSWGEVTEEIGKGLVENKVVINLFREIGRMFLDMSDGVKKDSGGMKDSVAELIKLFFGFGSAVIDVVQLVMPLFKTIGYGLQAMADAAAQGIILIRDGWDAASKFGADASKRLEDQWASVGEKSKVLEEAQSRFEYLIESSKQAQKEVVAGDQVTEEAFQKTNATIDSHIVKLTAAQEAAKAWAQSLAESANSTEEIFAIENGLLKAQFDAKLIT